MPVLPVDPARGILMPGGPQTQNPAYFAVPNGLIGYWGFDADCLDFTSNLALDISGRANNGSMLNVSAASLANGQVSNALTFNGSSVLAAASSVQLASAITTTTTFTIAEWINPDASQNAYANLFTQGSSSGIWLNSSKINFFYSGADHRSSTSISSGVWSHFAVVCNVGAVSFYLNGAPDGTASSGQSFAARNIGNDTLGGQSTESYKGLIDDVRIYNRAIDPWEVIQLYRAGLAGRRDAGPNLPQYLEVA